MLLTCFAVNAIVWTSSSVTEDPLKDGTKHSINWLKTSQAPNAITINIFYKNSKDGTKSTETRKVYYATQWSINYHPYMQVCYNI